MSMATPLLSTSGSRQNQKEDKSYNKILAKEVPDTASKGDSHAPLSSSCVSFHFEGISQTILPPLEETPESIGNKILQQSKSSQSANAIQNTRHWHSAYHQRLPHSSSTQKSNNQIQYFNDFEFYQSLCKQPNCVKVEIDAVCVKHNHYFCQGIQVQYRSFFLADKGSDLEETYTIRKSLGPLHFFARGIYAIGKIHSTWLQLGAGESIQKLKFYEGVVVDGIEFWTSHKRIIHIGGDGGDGASGSCSITGRIYPSISNNNNPIRISNHRCDDKSQLHQAPEIVAFAGTACEILQRIGYYTSSPLANNHPSSFTSKEKDGDGKCTTCSLQPVVKVPARILPMYQFTNHNGSYGPKCIFVSSPLQQQELHQRKESGRHGIPISNGLIWNDFSCYKSLCRRPGCKNVVISSVCIYYTTIDGHGGRIRSNNAVTNTSCCCYGIEVRYQLTYWDGTIRFANGPKHHFKKHHRTVHVMAGRHQQESIHSKWFHLDLEAGEYIKGIELLKQVENHRRRSSPPRNTITQDITLVTNFRIFSCCDSAAVASAPSTDATSGDGSFKSNNRSSRKKNLKEQDDRKWIRLFPPGRSMRIVAFAGILMGRQNDHHPLRRRAQFGGNSNDSRTNGGSLHRIGYYATNTAWEKIGTYLILRKLQQDNRAVPIIATRHAAGSHANRDEMEVERPTTIILDLFRLPEGLFQEVLSFLY